MEKRALKRKYGAVATDSVHKRIDRLASKLPKKRYVNIFPIPRGYDEFKDAFLNLCGIVLIVISKVWFEAYQYNVAENAQKKAKNLFEQYRRIHCQCVKCENGYHRNLAGKKILGAVDGLLEKYQLRREDAPFSLGKRFAQTTEMAAYLLFLTRSTCEHIR